MTMQDRLRGLRTSGDPAGVKARAHVGLGAVAARAILSVWRADRSAAKDTLSSRCPSNATSIAELEDDEVLYRDQHVKQMENRGAQLELQAQELGDRTRVLAAHEQFLVNAMWFQSWRLWVESCRVLVAQEAAQRRAFLADYDTVAARFAMQAAEVRARSQLVRIHDRSLETLTKDTVPRLRKWKELHEAGVLLQAEELVFRASLWAIEEGVISQGWMGTTKGEVLARLQVDREWREGCAKIQTEMRRALRQQESPLPDAGRSWWPRPWTKRAGPGAKRSGPGGIRRDF